VLFEISIQILWGNTRN